MNILTRLTNWWSSRQVVLNVLLVVGAFTVGDMKPVNDTVAVSAQPVFAGISPGEAKILEGQWLVMQRTANEGK